MSQILLYSRLLRIVKGRLVWNKIFKNIEESGIAHISKIHDNKKQTKSPTKINESKQTKSPPLKAINQRTSKSICPLTHVPDIELYTGTKIVLSGIRNFLYVTESDIKYHIAALKTK